MVGVVCAGSAVLYDGSVRGRGESVVSAQCPSDCRVSLYILESGIFCGAGNVVREGSKSHLVVFIGCNVDW